MFGKRKQQNDTDGEARKTSNPYEAEEARDYIAEAERILLNPDPMLQSAGVHATLQPLRDMMQTDMPQAAAALAALLRGPNGGHRKTAAFAFAQLGFDDDIVINALEIQKANENARGNIEALDAAIKTLRLIPWHTDASEIDRKRAVTNLYEGRRWDAGLERR
jgi:hypothetical protein